MWDVAAGQAVAAAFVGAPSPSPSAFIAAFTKEYGRYAGSGNEAEA